MIDRLDIPLDKNSDFFVDVAMGLIPGMSFISKFGENPVITTSSDPEDIWNFRGTYTFSTSADIDSLSSSDASDTQDIKIYGLDEDFKEVEQTITLQGQTKVSLTTSLIRVYRMVNIGSIDLAGTVYCYVDGAISSGVPDTDADVRAIIDDGDNQTMMLIYTVPAGKTALLLDSFIAYGKSSSTGADMILKMRPFGQVFQNKMKVSIIGTGTSVFSRAGRLVGKIPEKTDIKVTCSSVEATTSIVGMFNLLLIDNKLINQ